MKFLLLLGALVSLVAAQGLDNAFYSWTISFTATSQGSSLTSALSSQSSAWYKSLTHDKNWASLISAVPTQQAQALSVLVTANPSGSAYSSAAEAIATAPTTGAVPTSLQAWFSSAIVNLDCGQESVITKAGGSVARASGVSCSKGAAPGARLGGGADAWGLTLGVLTAGGLAGAALLL